ncbi:helix-turn-helix domain-containing protein [Candidatus Daviesbacteria bacterium]|nr:helix-turn-helix domain-containing protein [Candidatus Daviesbacteria bacterium]
MSNSEIARKLKSAREQLNLTQEEVAQKAKISVNYYARIERGELMPAFKKLQDLQKILKIKALKLTI